jgi:hypothetical protein
MEVAMTQTREEILRKKVEWMQRKRERMKNENITAYRALRAQEAKERRLRRKERDPEALRAEDRKKYDAMTVEVRVKRAEYMKQWHAKHPGKVQQYKEDRLKKTPFWWLYASARDRATKKNWDFDLVESDVVVPKVCPALGVPLRQDGKHARYSREADAPSIDRLDSSKGYTRDNIRVVSYRANVLKGDGTAREHELIAAYIRANGGE